MQHTIKCLFARDISLAPRFASRPKGLYVKTATQGLTSCFPLCGLSTGPGGLNRASYTCSPGTFLKDNAYEN